MVEPFLQEIDAFLVSRGMSESQLGRLALNDNRFVPRLRVGKHSPTVSTIEKVRAFMRNYRVPAKQDAAA